MIIEMHSHTAEYSTCSRVKAGELVRRTCALGLQGIVLTDHHYLWSAGELATLRQAAGVPGHFLLFSGQEVTTGDFGDVLVFGADRIFPPGTSTEEIRQLCRRAALVWAHPYRNGRIPAPERLLDPRLDGVEIFNANQSASENAVGLRDWQQHKFTAIAGTDIHSPDKIGFFPTVFEHPLGSIEELAAEIRQGRCRPVLPGIPGER